MARGNSTLRQRITAGLKGARAAGYDRPRVRIAPDETIEIETASIALPENDLDRDLEEWKARHGQD